MRKPLTLSQLKNKLCLGIVDLVDTTDFVSFGEVQTVYAGRATAYPNTTIFLYRVVGATLSGDTPKYLTVVGANQLFS